MSGQRGNQVGVFNLFVKITHKCASGHVAAGNGGDGDLLLRPCDRIQNHYLSVDAGFEHDEFDGFVVFLGTDEGE